MNWTQLPPSRPDGHSSSGRRGQFILALAPLADHTDSPFCRVCRKVSGKNFVTFREMVSAEAIVRGNEKTLKMCEFKKVERPIVIQIFGGKPATVAKAAEIIVKKFKPDGIDINMGCPVPKIARKGESGAALMKDQERACEIVRQVKRVLRSKLCSKLRRSEIPLSVKTRLGWSDPKDILEFAPKLEKAGADLIAIHGRTKMQGYSGKADWNIIGKVKKLVSIPVIANGDVVTPEDVEKCLVITKCDGVMIGRGVLGNPWFFRRCHSREGGNPVKQSKCRELLDPHLRGDDKVSLKEKIKTILYHAKLHEKRYGKNSMVTFRKHSMWYFKGNRFNIPDRKKLRQELAQIKTRKELKQILKKIRN